MTKILAFSDEIKHNHSIYPKMFTDKHLKSDEENINNKFINSIGRFTSKGRPFSILLLSEMIQDFNKVVAKMMPSGSAISLQYTVTQIKNCSLGVLNDVHYNLYLQCQYIDNDVSMMGDLRYFTPTGYKHEEKTLIIPEVESPAGHSFMHAGYNEMGILSTDHLTQAGLLDPNIMCAINPYDYFKNTQLGYEYYYEDQDTIVVVDESAFFTFVLTDVFDKVIRM